MVLTERDCPVHSAGGGVSKLELQENGTGGFFLACRTHGRVTLAYTTPQAAEAAPFVSPQTVRASKHTAPVGTPEPVKKGRK